MRPAHRIMPDAVLAGSPVILAQNAMPGFGVLTARELEIQRQARDAGRAEGLKQGHEQGLAEGRRRAEAEFSQARAALAAGLEALAAERRRVLAEGRAAALRLALAVARKVIHHEVRQSGEAAARVVDAAIKAAQEATVVRVRVHPGDRARIEEARGDQPPLALVEDQAIGRGGCIVETDCGSIEATVESQWDVVRAALDAAAALGAAEASD